MNERIRELADEAEAQYCDLGDASCFKRLGLVEAVVFKPEDLEKFAELIVEECAGIIESQDVDPSFKLRMSWAVKEYFGVEE
jgi:hypothetical protein